MDSQTLLDILGYKRQVLEQLLTVASIFGGFAVTGVIALRSDERRDRVHALAFGAMAVAAIAFVFATALDAIWLPMSRSNHLSEASLRTLLGTGDSVAWAVLVGAAGLIAALGLFGFARSRRMGLFVLLLAILAAVAFVLNVGALAGLF
ncbi:MAG TPA: hypothetical protein VIE43_14985 [Thermoanaerobaculia bacterium]|jgi:putative copper export protein|nr:hypothetical protein [Thermoanaerobaculia bacterium]